MHANAVCCTAQVWLDARGTGLDRDMWLRNCLAELDARPPKTWLQAHLFIKGFLSIGPSDPYTRFIPPEEFKQLTKFDVSGVGVNAVSAEEYQQKVVEKLPRGKTTADGGVWVAGLIKVRVPLHDGGSAVRQCYAPLWHHIHVYMVVLLSARCNCMHSHECSRRLLVADMLRKQRIAVLAACSLVGGHR